ncbi:hypothetical protein [Rhodococcus rhodnii]|nr:hypothetical protein [Rhodococcus rhodnii]
MGTTSFVAARDVVESVLSCIDSSGNLELGIVTNRFETIPKPLPVEALLDRIFAEQDAGDRSAKMMELFIAEV